jgi:hypothetical protein
METWCALANRIQRIATSNGSQVEVVAAAGVYEVNVTLQTSPPKDDDWGDDDDTAFVPCHFSVKNLDSLVLRGSEVGQTILDAQHTAVIFKSSIPDLVVTNVSFRNGLASNSFSAYGGAMQITSANSAVISGCSFMHCNSGFDNPGSGGALSYNAPYSRSIVANFTLSGCNFSDNRATFDGGAIKYNGYVGSPCFSMVGCLFSRNTAEVARAIAHGGSISYTPYTAGIWNMQNCTFVDNQAPNGNGGAVYFTPIAGFVWDMRNCYFRSNAALSGGALYLGSGDGTSTAGTGRVDISGTIFMGNEGLFGGSGGGSVFNRIPGAAISISWSNFSKNIAFVGATDLHSAGNITLHSCQITELQPGSVSVTSKGLVSSETSSFSCCKFCNESFGTDIVLVATGSASQVKCDLCATGQYNQEFGRQYFLNNALGKPACKHCEVGQYQSGAGAGSCTACTPGTFGTMGGSSLYSEACDKCAPGTYSQQAASVCYSCPVGQYQSPGEGCIICPASKYTALEGLDECKHCPYGGRCIDGIITPESGNYGADVGSGIVFMKCPSGYCLEANSDSVLGNNFSHHSYAQCGERSNRDPNGTLCGSCLPGNSQSITNCNCVNNNTCAGTARWFWLAALLYALFYASYFLASSTPVHNKEAARKKELQQPPLGDSGPGNKTRRIQQLAEKALQSRPGKAFMEGGFASAIFFYQMAGFVVSLAGFGAIVASYFKGMFGMQLGWLSPKTKHGGGYCIWADMHTITSIWLQYATPVLIAVVLAVISYFTRVCISQQVASQHPLKTLLGTVPSKAPGAYAKFVLLGYTILSETTLKLLNCAELPNGGSVLLYAGTVACGSWQIPIWVFFALLLACPLVPLAVYNARQLPRHWWLQQRADAVRYPSNAVARALYDTLASEVDKQYWFWPALLALQRLLMVAVPVVLTSNIVSSMVFVLVALAASMFQLSYKPYTNMDVNKYQAMLCGCLFMLTFLNVPNRVLSAAAVNVSPSLMAVTENIQVVTTFILLMPAVVPIVASLLWKIQSGTNDTNTSATTEMCQLDGGATEYKAMED